MESLNLHVGERHTIRLRGLGTAGYAWSATVEDARVVTVSAAGTAPRELTPDSSSAGLSTSRDELFEVLALNPGRTEVHFAQSRPWEKNKPPHASVDYAITVSAAI